MEVGIEGPMDGTTVEMFAVWKYFRSNQKEQRTNRLEELQSPGGKAFKDGWHFGSLRLSQKIIKRPLKSLFQNIRWDRCLANMGCTLSKAFKE